MHFENIFLLVVLIILFLNMLSCEKSLQFEKDCCKQLESMREYKEILSLCEMTNESY